MGRKRRKSERRSESPTAERRPASAVGGPGDISLPRWSRAWFSRHGATMAVCGLLALLAAIVFGQTLWHGFLDLDDFDYVFNNPHVREGIVGPGDRLGLHRSARGELAPADLDLAHAGLPGVRAMGGRASSDQRAAARGNGDVALSGLAADDGPPGAQRPGGGAVCHPSFAGGVGGLGGRAEGRVERPVLRAHALGLCRLCADAAFSWPRYALVVACFALGLMAKPMLVTLPLVLLLLDYWPLGRGLGAGNWGLGTGKADLPRPAAHRPPPTSSIRLIVEKLPLLALAAASCVVTLWAQSAALAGLENHSLGARAANAIVSLGEYLWRTFWPASLAPFYPYPPDGWPVLPAAVSGLALLGLSVAAIGGRRRFPYLFSGWLWFVGMLVPVIGLVQVGDQAMADRYTYLPQIGLLLALVWGADSLRQWYGLGERTAQDFGGADRRGADRLHDRPDASLAGWGGFVAAHARLHDGERLGPRKPGLGSGTPRESRRRPGRIRRGLSD